VFDIIEMLLTFGAGTILLLYEIVRMAKSSGVELKQFLTEGKCKYFLQQ
jgi:hypothetical protein